MRKGNAHSGPGREPFSIFPIGSFPSTICVSARAILRASAGGRSHIFGCPVREHIQQVSDVRIELHAFYRPAIVNVAVASIFSRNGTASQTGV